MREREGIWLIGLRAMDAPGHIPSKRLTHGFGVGAGISGAWVGGVPRKSQGNVRREFYIDWRVVTLETVQEKIYTGR